MKRQVVVHLGQLDFLHGRENVVLLGPPGTGKTHMAIALGVRACLAGQRVAFATATEWVARLGDAKRDGKLEAELRRLSFVPLIVVDEVGYIPFDPAAANATPSATNGWRAGDRIVGWLSRKSAATGVCARRRESVGGKGPFVGRRRGGLLTGSGRDLVAVELEEVSGRRLIT